MTPTGTLVLVRSPSLDPWYNLALEERLMDQAGRRGDRILYLWQNDRTVVIGRHQNAWTECRAALLEREGGRLARRTSGGGAVYHDRGNLNFSMILPRAEHDPNRSTGWILEAVRGLGLPAERSGRNDLLADGRKFSGNAYHLTEHAGLHHGTLLLHSDPEHIARYLAVSAAKLQSRGVASVRSRIVNLNDLDPALTLSALEQAVSSVFVQHLRRPGASPVEIRDTRQLENGVWSDAYRKQQSWTWRFGPALAFQAGVEGRFAWGGIALEFQLRQGLVQTCRVATDMMDPEFPATLERDLTGSRFHPDPLTAALIRAQDALTAERDAPYGVSRRGMLNDIACLLRDQLT